MIKLGLVLGGGFSKGAVQLGFLRGFYSIYPIESTKVISSSSIGALSALALANHKMDFLKQQYLTKNIVSIRHLKMNLKNRLVPEIVNQLVEGWNTQIPIYISGTCVNTLSTHYFYIDALANYEAIFKAVNITLTYPAINGLFKVYDKRLYIDGGALENIPTYPLEFYDLDFILILHCASNYLPPIHLFNRNALVIDLNLESCLDKNYSSFSFKSENMKSMLEAGEQYGEEFAKRIHLLESKEALKKELQALKRAECKKKKRCTSFNLVEILNRIHFSRPLR